MFNPNNTISENVYQLERRLEGQRERNRVLKQQNRYLKDQVESLTRQHNQMSLTLGKLLNQQQVRHIQPIQVPPVMPLTFPDARGGAI